MVPIGPRRSHFPAPPFLLLLLLLLLIPGSPALSQGLDVQALDRWIEAERQRWGLPGLAVAVVKDDSLVYARGFGVRKLGEPELVDEHTLFGVASVSKAFTAAALGILVDEGRLSWDDVISDHLPDFHLYDPYVTRTATVRDLLSHRVGVGRMTGNRLRWISSRDRSEAIQRIRHLGPEQTFRNGYVYSNVMYMVAGELIPAITGESWESFVESRIFRPLGMTRSSTSVTAIQDGENAAWPHQEIEGEVVTIARRNFDAVGPAASINSSLVEMEAWIRLHLGEPGVFQGRRLLSAEVMREMHRAQNHLPDGGMTGTLSSYGLGWNLGTYEGRRTSRHGGSTDGMNTNLVLVPEENLGVLVLTNSHNNLMNAIGNRIIDDFLGIPDRGWGDRIREGYEENHRRVLAAREAIHAARVQGTSPSVPVAAFGGRFESDLYADASVRLEGEGLVLHLWEDDDMVADLEHWHHDTFRAVWRNRAMREEFVHFTRGQDGGVDALHIEWVLRPLLLQVGAYPSTYTRMASFQRVSAELTDRQE